MGRREHLGLGALFHDPAALHHYMSFHAVVPAPCTLLNGVRKLPPATVRVIERDGRSRDHCYWRLHFGPQGEDRERSYEDFRHAASYLNLIGDLE